VAHAFLVEYLRAAEAEQQQQQQQHGSERAAHLQAIHPTPPPVPSLPYSVKKKRLICRMFQKETNLSISK